MRPLGLALLAAWLASACLCSPPSSQPAAPEQNSFHYNKHVNPFMQLHRLPGNNHNHSAPAASPGAATCNDGSPVGYYARLNSHSKSWIIYLQGGGFCSGPHSCRQRWLHSPHLMSSNGWPKLKSVDGILSAEPRDNPYLWNANHIYVPYCSSDSWTGLRPAKPRRPAPEPAQEPTATDGAPPAPASFAFMGSLILERVLESLFEDLGPESSLYGAKYILLAGDSAGATGVIMNLDRVREFVLAKANRMRANCSLSNSDQIGCDSSREPTVLRGLADSGWFLDNQPYELPTSAAAAEHQQPADSELALSELASDEQPSLVRLLEEEASPPDCERAPCAPLQSIRQAMGHWNGQVPAACAAQHPAEPWLCYFGYRAYPSLRTPLFVVQWLYDEAQLLVDNVARPDTSGQWHYVNKVARQLRASLENVSALFAPSCFSHSLVLRKAWNEININGLKLPHVLNSWEEQSLLEPGTAIAAGAPSAPAPAPTLAPAPTPAPPTTSTTATPPPHRSQQRARAPAPAEPTAAELRASPELRHIAHRSAARTRSRKRRRNNQAQPHARPRQPAPARPRPAPSPTETPPPDTAGGAPNELGLSVPAELAAMLEGSPPAELLFSGRLSREQPLGLAGGRLGRSTIVDDATLMLTNTVPDDGGPAPAPADAPQPAAAAAAAASQLGPKQGPPDRFRLIDSCGWPQCNRDCPAPDFTLGWLQL